MRSWTGWKRLSVNCSSKHDLPTPAWVTCQHMAVRLPGIGRDAPLLIVSVLCSSRAACCDYSTGSASHNSSCRRMNTPSLATWGISGFLPPFARQFFCQPNFPTGPLLRSPQAAARIADLCGFCALLRNHPAGRLLGKGHTCVPYDDVLEQV